MDNFIEAHFCSIEAQSSIYGLTSLYAGNYSRKVLVSSCGRRVYALEFSRNRKDAVFSTREAQFTYIPARAELIAIDAFNQDTCKREFVVGITLCKIDPDGKQTKYFNIYSDWEPRDDCVLENIAQGCLSICLRFVPFHLTHCEIHLGREPEMVWLLSGDDCRVHMYREDKHRQTYREEPSGLFFPEFQDLGTIVLWMDFIIFLKSRVTAFGCQDSSIIVARVITCPETQIEATWKIQHDSPIPYVQLFHDTNLAASRFASAEESIYKGDLRGAIHLLVVSAAEASVVYRDVLRNGLALDCQRMLPGSSKYDAVVCGVVADIDMDGKNEILIGTHGQQLLVYKWIEDKEVQNKKGAYECIDEKLFTSALYTMRYMDITGDGVKELLILSAKGLHIFQHDMEKVLKIFEERAKLLASTATREEIIRILIFNQ